jgi:hypothetical protein
MPADDAKICQLKKQGLSLRDIAEHFPGRTPGAIEVRYHTKLKSTGGVTEGDGLDCSRRVVGCVFMSVVGMHHPRWVGRNWRIGLQLLPNSRSSQELVAGIASARVAFQAQPVGRT